MTRRSKLQICLDVLWSIKNGTSKPTQIMYESNLSWRPLQHILKLLVSKELIIEIDTRNTRKTDKRTKRRYEITQKGENIVRYLNRAKDLLKLEKIPTIR